MASNLNSLRETSFAPLYKQVKDLLLQSLDDGKWKPGESIPSEQELAQIFQVSQGTVRKAVDELSKDKVLIRRQGKGTFVATHREAEVRYRFLNLVPDDVPVKQRARSQILSCEEVCAESEQAKRLGLSVGDPLIFIRRLLFLDNSPTIIDHIWLRADLFQGLDLAMLERNRAPLYSLFESEFGISMVGADESLKAVVADESQAALLDVEVGTPLLQVIRTTYRYGNKPVEIRQGFYLTKHFHYKNSLK